MQRYKDILFIWTPESKDKRNVSSLLSRNLNNGFDNNDGYYKVVVGDHLLYRYEVLAIMDKGAFGQVVRCLDHKLQAEIAIKINRNSTYDHSSSKTEIAILRKLQEGIPVENKEEQWANQYKERVVEFIDSFFFRNHFVTIITINTLVPCL